jgi:hypothetical protein
MSIARDLRCLRLLFAIPEVVELSVLIGVGGWGWLSSSSVVQSGTASWPLAKRPPASTSVADAATLQSLWQTVWIGPLEDGFSVGTLVGTRELELR